jgi:hypothetical protein
VLSHADSNPLNAHGLIAHTRKVRDDLDDADHQA